MIRECGAKAKTNGHKPCKRFAMANGRCHLHGGATPKNIPRPKTKEARLKQERANWKHGRYSREAITKSRALRELLTESKELLSLIGSVLART